MDSVSLALFSAFTVKVVLPFFFVLHWSIYPPLIRHSVMLFDLKRVLNLTVPPSFLVLIYCSRLVLMSCALTSLKCTPTTHFDLPHSKQLLSFLQLRFLVFDFSLQVFPYENFFSAFPFLLRFPHIELHWSLTSNHEDHCHLFYHFSSSSGSSGSPGNVRGGTSGRPDRLPKRLST